jgi:hypothetical protein
VGCPVGLNRCLFHPDLPLTPSAASRSCCGLELHMGAGGADQELPNIMPCDVENLDNVGYSGTDFLDDRANCTRQRGDGPGPR